MASGGDDALDTKLENEISLVEQQRQATEGDEAELLGDEAESARNLLSQSMAVEHALGELDSEKHQNPDAAGFNELATGLTAYAEQFDKQDLAQTPAPAATQPADAPGRSAPGIGRIGKHGSKPSSQRKGPEIWWLESEHVIPFATGKQLWDVIGLVVPGRGGHEDRGQTTIMIYEKAARFKTLVDNLISDAFKSRIASVDVVQRMRRARLLIESGQPEEARAEVEDVLHLMFKALSAAREDAVERTNAAIVSESNMKMEGSSQTNAERRGRPGIPEDAVPYPVQVEGAASRQQDDIINLAAEELEAANILR